MVLHGFAWRCAGGAFAAWFGCTRSARHGFAWRYVGSEGDGVRGAGLAIRARCAARFRCFTRFVVSLARVTSKFSAATQP